MFFLYMFVLLLGDVCKRFAIPAIGLIAVITIIAGVTGGSWLWASIISAAVAAIIIFGITIYGMTHGW